MPLHSEPKTTAEKLALHLEVTYGLMLDPARHKALCAEIEAFAPAFADEHAEKLIQADTSGGAD